ncbi:MAG: glycoside hydrolase family 2, partial [Bacteroidales bacterium]
MGKTLINYAFHGALYIAMSFVGRQAYADSSSSEYYRQITDPSLITINQEAPRATFIPYATDKQAILNDRSSSPYFLSLNGTWKFHYTENPEERIVRFDKVQEIASEWADIKVPGNWEVQGFGIPIYVNHPYEFVSPQKPYMQKPQPPLVPEKFNPVGTYFRTFELPESWDGRDVFISVDAAKSATYIYVNGHFAGMGKDSKTPARYKITSLLRSGKNELVIQSFRWSDASYLECQDFWRLSGIEREVYLYTQPKTRFSDFEVIAGLDDRYENGELVLKADIAGNASGYSVAYRLLDASGKEVTQGVRSVQNGSVRMDAVIPSVDKWSAEYPELY